MKAAMKIGLTLRFISLRVPRAPRQKTRYWKIHLAIKNDRKVAHFGKKMCSIMALLITLCSPRSCRLKK